jgi:hypothetical protein
MTEGTERKKLHISTDTFIDIVHQLEVIPAWAPVFDPSAIASPADIELWQKLFVGLTVDGARHTIQMHRQLNPDPAIIPDHVRHKWP